MRTLYVSEKLLGAANAIPELHGASAQIADGSGARPRPSPHTTATFSSSASARSCGWSRPCSRTRRSTRRSICVDDAARFAICVLSGHVGRGNVFTERVAAVLGAQAVVTTASDAIGTLTVDILGRDLGWTLDDPDRNVTRGCAAVVNAAPVALRAGDGRAHVVAARQAPAAGRALHHYARRGRSGARSRSC